MFRKAREVDVDTDESRLLQELIGLGCHLGFVVDAAFAIEPMFLSGVASASSFVSIHVPAARKLGNDWVHRAACS